MMKSDELNRHVHGNYEEKTAPSSNVNVTDEDESKEIIVHETLSENLSMDVSESDRFSDKVLCTMISFDSSSSVSLTFNDGAVSYV